MIHVQTDAIMLNEGVCKSGQSDQIIYNSQNQNENITQTEIQIKSGPQSLRKIECTHCKIIFTCKKIGSYKMLQVAEISVYIS